MPYDWTRSVAFYSLSLSAAAASAIAVLEIIFTVPALLESPSKKIVETSISRCASGGPRPVAIRLLAQIVLLGSRFLMLNDIIINDFRFYISRSRTNIKWREELSFAGKTDLVGTARGNRRDAGSQ